MTECTLEQSLPNWLAIRKQLVAPSLTAYSGKSTERMKTASQIETLLRRKELLPKARAGDANAQFDLGCAYDFERPKRRDRAIYWYQKAAEQGHAEAQNYLG